MLNGILNTSVKQKWGEQTAILRTDPGGFKVLSLRESEKENIMNLILLPNHLKKYF